VHEDDPQRPTLVYDVCKGAAEGIGRNYARDHDLEFIALRFSQIYGPGKVARHGNYGVLSRIIEGPVHGEAVDIPQGGDQRDDMIYVDDVAEGTVLAALHERPRYTEYNISRGTGTTLRDLADVVRATVPGARIRIGGGLDYLGFGVNYSCIMDNTRAREDLGFRPKFDLAGGVHDYVAEMKRLGI
jgi:UDP-glucose 4-epimerase